MEETTVYFNAIFESMSPVIEYVSPPIWGASQPICRKTSGAYVEAHSLLDCLTYPESFKLMVQKKKEKKKTWPNVKK